MLITGADGVTRTVPTTSLGFYSFDALPAQAYTVRVVSRSYRFDPRNVELNGSLAEVNFTGFE